jgi:hypothetical protein
MDWQVIAIALTSLLGMGCLLFGYYRNDSLGWKVLGWSLIVITAVAAVTLVAYPLPSPLLESRF